MPSLSELLADKIKSAGLNKTKAAEAIGVSLPSFRSVLLGKSVPNKRSVDRYAKFLGISAAEIAKSKPGKSVGKTKGKPGRPKGPGKPGRPKGTGKPGRPKGSTKAKSASSKGNSISGAMDLIASVLGAAEELLSDDLAMTVHALDKRTREKIAFLLG